MERKWYALGFAMTMAAGIVVACGSDDDGSNNGSGSSNNTGGKGAVGGIDVAACFGCGNERCAAEAEACNALGDSCTDLMSCWLECVNDATCISKCDASRVKPEDVARLNTYLTCAVLSCAAECTPDISTITASGTGTGTSTSAGPGGGSGPSGPRVPCSQEGEARGACYEGTLQVCEGGVWATGDCAGCGIVTPRNTCGQITAFTLEERGNEFVRVPEVQTTFTQTASAITAEWYLEASQLGVIQFVMSSPIDYERVEITGSGAELVTLEDDGGASGCYFEVQPSGRLEHLWQFNPTTFEVEWNGCWGDWNASGEAENATVLNVRTPISLRNDLVTLTITRILL